MEEILLTRLTTFANNIEVLARNAQALCSQSPWTNAQLEESSIVASKLQSIINRFSSDLYQYFNISQNTNADEISNLTTSQLEGEGILSEINARIEHFNKSNKAVEVNTLTRRSKLPELNLQTFKGDVLSWYPFWDQFQSTIGRRDLCDVDKLLYLKASLEGEPKIMIDGLETTNNSYQIAVDTLKNRYGRPEQIIDAHYAALNKIKPALKFEECRKTLDEIERHLRVLQSLGEDISHNHLRYLIMEKFPEDIVYEIKLKGATESIQNLRNQLNMVITAREEAKGYKERNKLDENKYTTEVLHTRDTNKRKTINKHRFQHNKNFKKVNKAKSSTAAFSGTFTSRKRSYDIKKENEENQPESKRRKLQCIFCKNNHFNDQCKEYKTVEDRKKQLKDRCYHCLSRGHKQTECRKKIFVCVYCKTKHNRALCPKKFSTQTEVKQVNTLHVHGEGSTVLQTAVIDAIGRNRVIKRCRLILDSGSQRSYVTTKVAKELELAVEEEDHLFVFTFGTDKPKEIKSNLVKLCLRTKEDKLKIIFANVVPVITQGVSYLRKELLEHVNRYDQNLVLADDNSLSDRVDILIGNDYYYSLMNTEKIELKENLYLVDSVFGWILSGKPQEGRNEDLTVLTYFQTSYENKLNEPDPPLDMGSVKNLWELESIGITDSPNSNRDEEAIRTFNETTVVKDNIYIVSWPWNEYPPDLPSNFGLAYGRLVSLLKRMDKETLMIYEQTLKDQFDKGVIEIVPNNDEVDHPVHFLAHHGISAPGKALRIVYDASAKVKDSKSLNECLYRGPIMLEDLTGLLIKFRCHEIGLTADVEKAFLQVGLHDKDRDVTRFLWLKDISKPATKENLMIYRFTRVPFGIISSPYLLNATIRHHLMNSDSEHVRNLANDIYVDNLLTGANNLREATQIYDDCKSAFKQISMNIREWSSNGKSLTNIITDCNKDDIVKTLGLDWNLNKDTLHMRVKLKNNAITKRGLLKTIASIYDPCGFVAPIVLPAKLLLQSLWKENKKWDLPVSNEVKEKWEIILKDLDTVKSICLPRLMSNNKDCELHCFTDSSIVAYAAVVYLLQENNLKFVIGKSRLTPLKDQDNLKIPRLELLGVVIGNRLLQYVAKYLPIQVTKQVLWCDSQIVISWYKSNKLLVPFVARRIEEIKRNKCLDVRYIPSILNPADLATRPIKSKEELDKWLDGPAFLFKNPAAWPSAPVEENTLLTREGLSKHTTQVSERKITDLTSKKEIATLSKEDSMMKILDKDHLTLTETDNKIKSEVQEIIRIQKQYFLEESSLKRTHLTRNLGLFKDIDGLLRSEGRLTHSDLSYEMKHPILLPKDCEFTNKVIKEIHEENYHVGVPHTLSKVRQRFWIPQGRAQVQKVISKCPQCVKHGGGAYTLPNTPALPPERVKYETPFTYVGMDYFGPMLVKTDKGQGKRWVCLFTCLVIRAIHLEIVKDMSTDECSLAFRRFVAARGIPTMIVSDNALQFKLLSEIVTGISSATKRIQWKFIPQLAPWHGGVYERLVAVVKHCLKRTLEKHLIGDNQLLTIIKEVQAIVNTRPLTYVGNDQEHILKPADFLTPGRCINIDNLEEKLLTSSTSTKQQLLQGWKRDEMIMNEYKDMFLNQYLLSLRERYNHSPKQVRVKAKLEPCIGDIVQIKGESKNRGNWKVGRVVELLKGIDGLCRVAKVKVGDAIFTRSIAHLYPLEAEESPLSEDITRDQSCIKQSVSSPCEGDHNSEDLSILMRESLISSEDESNQVITNKMDVTKHKEMMDNTEGHNEINGAIKDDTMNGSDERSNGHLRRKHRRLIRSK